MACDPGACFAYAHTNFVILGKVMEKATGRSLAELIRTGVLAPLGLIDTRSDVTARIPPPVLHALDAERGLVEIAGIMAYQPAAGIALALATTDGAATKEPRPAEQLFNRLGRYLSPVMPPRPLGG